MSGRMEHDIQTEALIKRRLENMPDFINDWIIELSARGVKPKSKYDMLTKISRFLEFINKNIEDVTIDDITERKVKEYVIAKQTKTVEGNIVPTSFSYQKGIRTVLNLFLDYLYQNGLIDANYMTRIKKIKGNDLKRINRNRKYLTKDDFKKILIAVSDGSKMKFDRIRIRDYAIMHLLMTTGMRETALTEIDVSDINFKDKTIFIIDKGEIEHDYILNDETYESLKKYLRIRNTFVQNYLTDALFLSEKGKRISPKTIAYIVRKYTKKALGYELSPHKIRGGVVTILYEEWGDLELVRRAIGHSDITTTQRYATTNNYEKQQMASTMRL